MQKSIERAKLRRAEEEKKKNEQTKARCAEKLRLLDMKKSTSDNINESTVITTSIVNILIFKKKI